MNDQERWLNVKKAAERCGVTPSFLYMHVRAGDGPPCTKMGRKILFKADELEVWILARRHAPEPA